MTDFDLTRQSWLSRLGGSLFGALFGLIVFLGSFVLEFWNEGRAIAEFRALEEGAKQVRIVPINAINADNDHKLVYVSGPATTNEKLSDRQFDISVSALKLKRSADMFQWHETSHERRHKKLGGGTETETNYKYEKRWSEHAINSDRFHDADSHRNPKTLPIESHTDIANNIRVGEFELSSSMLNKINNFQPLKLTPENNLKLSYVGPRPIKIVDGYVYIGNDPANPEVGDARIEFSSIPPEPVSVVAQQSGDRLHSYRTSNGNEIELIETGSVPASAMFQEAKLENSALTWGLRVGGFVMMFFGLLMIVSPLVVLADVLPFMGNLLGYTTGFASFGLALFLSLITMSIGWIFYRPLIGITIAVLGTALGLGIMRVSKKGNS